MELDFGGADVAGDIDEYGARATGLRQIERVAERAGQLFGILQQVTVLDDGHRDAHDVRFLKGIRADDGLRHLAGDDNERDAVHVRRGDAGHRIRGARAGRDNDDTGLAGSARIAIRLMRCALFVTGEHMVNLLRIVQGIVDLDGLSSGITEHGVHTLGLQAGDNGLSTGEHLALLGCLAAVKRQAAARGPLLSLLFCTH